jgi:hypothetical protein
MGRLSLTIRDLDDPDIPLVATSDDLIVEAAKRAIVDRLRGEPAKRGAGKLIDLARPPQGGSDDSDE